ncbi:MAG: hypothetical protein HQL37_00335 [Alphaproteobacteria bacterium]|nr:hypothetical protein [Alphaproteobacteria bacterium]
MSIQVKIDETDKQIANVSGKIKFIADNHDRYQQMLTGGYTTQQDRLHSGKAIRELAKQFRVSALDFSFAPEVREKLRDNAPFSLAHTLVEVTVTGVTDLDVIAFAQALPAAFTGWARIEGLSLIKSHPVEFVSMTGPPRKDSSDAPQTKEASAIVDFLKPPPSLQPGFVDGKIKIGWYAVALPEARGCKP